MHWPIKTEVQMAVHGFHPDAFAPCPISVALSGYVSYYTPFGGAEGRPPPNSQGARSMPKLSIFAAAAALAITTFVLPAMAQEDAADTGMCLNLSTIKETKVIDDQTILFYMRGGKIYRNDLPYRCSGLSFEEGFSYSTSINKLCGNREIITVLDRGTKCGLGGFTEVSEDQAQALIDEKYARRRGEASAEAETE